jgi:vacuolar-type H+-ATPase catalytic subunit A/Vma1
LLQKEENFAEILQLVGKHTIGEDDKIALEVVRVYENNFL